EVNLKVPPNAVVGVPLPGQVTLTNSGATEVAAVAVTAQFDAGLEHESRTNPVVVEVGTVGPGQTRSFPLVLTPRQAGKSTIRVLVTAAGVAVARDERVVAVEQARLGLDMRGPARANVGDTLTWEIRVTNAAAVALTNVVVQSRLPPEVGQPQPSSGGRVE